MTDRTSHVKSRALRIAARVLNSRLFSSAIDADGGRFLEDLFLGNPDLASNFAGSSDFKDLLFETPGALEKLLGDKRLQQGVIDSPAVVHTLVQSQEAREVILGDGEFLNQLLADGRIQDVLFADRELLKLLINRDEFREMLLNTPAELSKWLGDERLRSLVLSNGALLESLLGSDRARNTLLGQPGLLAPLLHEKRFTSLVLSTPGILDKYLADPSLVCSQINYDKNLIAISNDDGLESSLRSHFLSSYPVLGELVTKLTGLNEAGIQNLADPVEFERLIARVLNGSKDVQNLVMDIVAPDDCIMLGDYSIQGFDRRSLWVLLNELYLHQDYYFESNSKDPFIIDCGSSFGLSIFYFKTLYPAAKILAFEPQKGVRELLEANISNNQLQDVRVLPFALLDEAKEIDFFEDAGDVMAGRVVDDKDGVQIATYKVEARLLSGFIDRKVDFLKLDIEGPEDRVLNEIREKLDFVDTMFCEFHSEENEDLDRLVGILSILRNAGFIASVAKAYGAHKYTSVKPFMYLGRKQSSVIFAKRSLAND